MVAIPENGRLDEHSFPSLLIRIHDADFSGCLKITKQSIEKTFLFASGGAVSVESSLKSDSLGAQLLTAGKITQEDCSRLRSLTQSDGCQESAALLKLDLMNPRDLFGALRDQVRIALLESIAWTEGSFSIDPEARVPGGALAFRPELYLLLQEGIELHWPPERVFGGLEAKLMQYATSNNQFKELQQQLPSDDAVLEFQGGLDGSQTLWKLLQQAKTPRALATAWVIDAAGGIDYRDEAAEEEQEAPLEVEVVFQDTPSDRSDPKAAGAAVAARRAPAPRGVATDLATQISRRFEQMDDLNYYECFDLAPDVPMIDIKKAYLLAAKRYHPDALARAGLGDELRRQANKIFSKISKAYATLSNPRKRGEYDSALGSDSSPIDAEHLANAETLYRKGEVLLGLGNFKGAVEFLAPAVDLWPDEADYQSALGWALFKKMPSEPEPSREHLEKAVTMAPEDATASFRLSFVLRALGQSADADAWLRRSRQLDPNIA